MSEPALTCESNTIFRQNYTRKLFTAFKKAYSCCFGLKEKSRFQRFNPKKSFITSTTDVAGKNKKQKRERELNSNNES